MSDFVKRFLGYGELNSSFWFIGPEAGGGKNLDELHRRAHVWSESGRQDTEDLQAYHSKLELPAKEDWSKNIQSTWGALIRVFLTFEGVTVTEATDVMCFQRDSFGKLGGNNAILDLSQLSAPSQNKWSALDSKIGWLRDRALYEGQVLPGRQASIQRKLSEHKDKEKVVLFFGSTHRSTWEAISGVKFEPSGLPSLLCRHSGDTLFAMMPHPNAIRPSGKGAKNRRLAEIGSELRRMRERAIEQRR